MTLYDAMTIAYPPGITFTCRECGAERRNGEPHVCGPIEQPCAQFALRLDYADYTKVQTALHRDRNWLAIERAKAGIERDEFWSLEIAATDRAIAAVEAAEVVTH